ncbi:MAG TPA: hypothetical protein VFP84_33670 [Kofleriaceae bacterium]|nr:hypothetical protein [Kofleriaceae bacterium]
MKNILRSALVLGALVSTPVIAMADPTPAPSTDKAPADKKMPNKKTDAKSPSTDKAPSTDTTPAPTK